MSKALKIEFQNILTFTNNSCQLLYQTHVDYLCIECDQFSNIFIIKRKSLVF
jgi:hypothetical protein